MRKRILFVDINSNGCMVKLPSLFHQQSIDCYGLSQADDLLFKSSYLRGKYGIPVSGEKIKISDLINSAFFAINECKPDLLITNEEMVISKFIAHRDFLQGRGGKTPLEFEYCKLIDRSFIADKTLLYRSRSLEVTKEAGFPVPNFQVIQSPAELDDVLQNFPRPFYLKVSFTVGGQGVLKITERDKDEWIKSALSEFFKPDPHNPYVAQAPVIGKEMTISFTAHKGRLLGYTVSEPLKTVLTGGPSCYLQTHYRPNWLEPISNFINLTGYDGFGGFDILEVEGHPLPFVIEANMRLTHSVPATRQQGTDLIKLFSDALKNEVVDTTPQHNLSDIRIALFPEEAMRLPESPLLESGLVAAPWSDPGAMAGLARYIRRNIAYPPLDLEQRYLKKLEKKNAV